jgi:hypothetical protein
MKGLSESQYRILLYAYSDSHDVYEQDYIGDSFGFSKRSLKSLVSKGLLDADDDEFAITDDGIAALGAKYRRKPRSALSAAKQALGVFLPDDEPLTGSSIPRVAVDEHGDEVLWTDTSDVLAAVYDSYPGDETLVAASCAATMSTAAGFPLEAEKVRHVVYLSIVSD